LPEKTRRRNLGLEKNLEDLFDLMGKVQVPSGISEQRIVRSWSLMMSGGSAITAIVEVSHPWQHLLPGRDTLFKHHVCEHALYLFSWRVANRRCCRLHRVHATMDNNAIGAAYGSRISDLQRLSGFHSSSSVMVCFVHDPPARRDEGRQV
jgi:hypothetical protein